MPQTKSGAQHNEWISFMKKAKEAYQEFKEARKADIQQKPANRKLTNKVRRPEQIQHTTAGSMQVGSKNTPNTHVRSFLIA